MCDMGMCKLQDLWGWIISLFFVYIMLLCIKLLTVFLLRPHMQHNSAYFVSAN